MRKRFWIGLACTGLALGVWWHWAGDAPSAPVEEDPVTATAIVAPLRITVESTGRVVPAQEIEIKCKASGEVIELPKDVSDTVKRGDILVQLNPADEQRAVRLAEASLAVSEANLEKSRLRLHVARKNLATERERSGAALRSAEMRVREAEAKLERTRELHSRQILSRELVEAAETAAALASAEQVNANARIADHRAAELEIELLTQDVHIAEAGVETDTLALLNARQRLADTTVHAPIDGVVSEREVQVGQIIASGINNVGGGTTLLKLMDTARVYVLVAVDESDIGRITLGQDARIQVDAHPGRTFRGEVVRIASRGTTVNNVVTFEVKVEVHDRRGAERALLKPEMTAHVEIVVLDADAVLQVPARAVRRSRGAVTVTRVEADGSVGEVVVEAGHTDGESIQIRGGLSEGDLVRIPRRGRESGWTGPDNEARQQRRTEHMNRQIMGGRGR